MKLLLILISIQIASAQVPPPDSEVWAIGLDYYPFKKEKETSALLSLECEKTKKCEAYSAVLKKSQTKVAESDRGGGKNPGAVVCKKNYGGEVIVLRDPAGNENAFCKFKDKSLASVSDLF